jgi:hypothetical protein
MGKLHFRGQVFKEVNYFVVAPVVDYFNSSPDFYFCISWIGFYEAGYLDK